MSKKNTETAKDSPLEPVPTPIPTSTAAAPAVTKPKVKPRYVVLRNALNQVVRLHIETEEGVSELKLEPRAEMPVREDALSPQVHRLVAQGVIRIR